MNYLFCVQVPDSWDKLSSYFADGVNHEWLTLLSQVYLHILAIHKFHNNMEFIVLLLIIDFPHKVKILYNIWML
jgi:hypothetical protein